MTRPLTILLGLLLAAGALLAPPARAGGLGDVVNQLRDSGGRYRWASASLRAADCSGLVSVAQSLAMGQPIHRLGDTRTLMAGRWPHAISGAVPGNRFVIGGDSSHMVASILGVNVEARTSGEPFLIGPAARSPFSYAKVWHIDPAVLVAA